MKIKENWLVENRLCSLDEKVRIEIGPQIIDLECTDENLKDGVTAAHYHVGSRDAIGRVIMPERVKGVDPRLGGVKEGETMKVVDWKAKFVPHIWKIYKWQEKASQFVKVGEEAELATALKKAHKLAGG